MLGSGRFGLTLFLTPCARSAFGKSILGRVRLSIDRARHALKESSSLWGLAALSRSPRPRACVPYLLIRVL